MKSLVKILFGLSILFLSVYKLSSQEFNHKKISFHITTHDDKHLPAQVMKGDEDRKLILFINGSTPYDEKGNIGASWTDQGKMITQKHEFYTRFIQVMHSKGYSVATMAKRSFVYPTEIPRPNTLDLSLDIFSFITEMKRQKYIKDENDLVIVGYSEGSMIATKVLALLKSSPYACVLLGSGSMSANFHNLTVENFHHTDHLRKTKKWTDQQIETEIDQLRSINDSLRNMSELDFEHHFKNSKPFGFGFAAWESYYIDKEWPLYNSVPNIVYANVPLLMCIAENDSAMPLKIAEQNFKQLTEYGFKKGTFRIINDEVHQYKKYDVYAIIDHWLTSKFKSTQFKLNSKDSLSIEEYNQSKEVINQIAALSYGGQQPKESILIYQKALTNEYMEDRNWFELGIKLVANNHLDEAYQAFNRSSDPSFIANFASLTWMGHLEDLKGNREEAIKYYKKALQQYPGFPVQHDNWNIHIDKSWIEKRLITPFVGINMTE